MIRRLLQPLPALAGALLGVYLAVTYLDDGWRRPVVVVVSLVVVIAVLFGLGRIGFPRRPFHAGYLMEAGLGFQTLGAGVAGAVLIWFLIDKAPTSATPTTREKEVWAAISGALTAYLGTLIIKPEGEIWNPVKTAIGSVFGDRFKARKNTLEKDARSAVQSPRYGAEDPKHRGHVVDGWGWDARRLRTRHIQDFLVSK